MSNHNYTQMTVGITGAGAISDIFLQNMINRFEILNVKSICSRNFAKAEKKASQYGIQATTYEAMLQDPEIDIIVNLTPADAHFEIIKAALSAGKHVFTEKAMAETFQQARDLCRLADEKGLVLGSAPETFMGSACQTGSKAVREGLTGEVTSFHIQANRNLDLLTSFAPSLRVPGGGIGMDYGIYYLTEVLSILGPVRQVAGIRRNPQHVRENIIPNHPEFGQPFTIADETQLYGFIELANGICGTIHLNGESILQDEGGIEIFGKKGILRLPCANYMGGQVAFAPQSSDWSKRTESTVLESQYTFSDNSRGIGVADMAWAICAGKRNRASKEMAAHAVEVFEALYQSSDDGQRKTLTSTFEMPEAMPENYAVGREETYFVG